MRAMRLRALLLLTLVAAAACDRPAPERVPAPIVYTMRFPSPDAHLANIEARIPAGGETTIELMLPVWSPGYYRVEDYAGNVKEFRAEGVSGAPLSVSKPKENHWAVATGASAATATRRSATTTRGRSSGFCSTRVSAARPMVRSRWTTG